MTIHEYLRAHGFAKCFVEEGDPTFYIYMWKQSFFVWGYLDANTMHILAAGRNGLQFCTSCCETEVTSRYLMQSNLREIENDTAYSITVRGDLIAFLNSVECRALIANSTMISNPPGVIDAILIPDQVKDKIQHAADLRMHTVSEEDAPGVLEKYIQRELFAKQFEYLGKYPKILQAALKYYFTDLARQIGVYDSIYNRSALAAVQSLFEN